jgi:uncharacterized protein with GYD domain
VEETAMANFVMLFRFTRQGLQAVKESPERVDSLKKVFASHGARVKDFYATLGGFDTMFIVEAPDDETVARLSLMIGKEGNVHVETHRAFTEEEFRTMVAQLP